MHSEYFSISDSLKKEVSLAKKEKRRVVACGTTSLRTLEFASNKNGEIIKKSGFCNLFIYPTFKFNIVSALITNFHLPKSTLLMLVSAFAGRDEIFFAYKKAIEKKYRFFSYGDAMFIK